jgi:serine protease Do
MKATLSRFALLAILAGPITAQEVEKSAAPVKVDPTPVSRQAGVITSFAPVVEKIAPCVVQISTTKRMTGRQRQNNPFFNDEMLRRWFGLPDMEEGDEPVPPAPRRRGGGRPEPFGLGSGVIVSPEGHILTNNHVIEGADEIVVTLGNGKKEYKAKKIGTDPGTDLAVLKIDNGSAMPAITFADTDKLRVGDFTIAVGNPFGLTQTVSMGIVSAMGRNEMGIVAYENFIQTDASINPGNSGGALVDIEGRLVGINTAIFSRTGTSAGIGFAVPANLARSTMDSILKHGRVVRGFMGVGQMQPVTEDLAAKLKLKGTDGVIINQVEATSPAQKAGMEPGDVIAEIDGKKIGSPSELMMTIGGKMPGDKVNVTYVRRGTEKRAEIVLVERPADERSRSPVPEPEKKAPDVLDGVSVADIDAEARKKYKIDEKVEGVVVTEIDENCPSYAAELRVGDVIQEIEQNPVKTSDDAVKLSEQLKQEKTVLLRVVKRGASRMLVVKENE